MARKTRVPAAPADRRLLARIRRVFAPDSKKAGKLAIDRLLARASDREGGEALVALVESDERLRTFLSGVFGSSPYLLELAVGDPARLARILQAEPEARIAALVAEAVGAADEEEAGLMRRLRLLKQEVALTLALCDLGGALPTMTITESLTRLADAALSAALRFALRDMAARGKIGLLDDDDPEKGSGLIVLAMGKGGAFELNYSSDIDLVVLFDHARVKGRLSDPEEAIDLFVRITKRMVKLLQERTVDGYVFRVDLRLRPDPGATPIAMSVDAALQYYESMGQNWERAALVKARACAGDIEAGERFLKEIRPYIWRKHFDYASIADVHSIKRQIHAHRGHDAVAVLGHNVKLGRGGIREIEFFVQTQQLIAGGRDPKLRGRSTLAMLDALVAQGWIGARVRDQLAGAYLFLRDVEHRIQMVADQQTHSVPEDAAGAGRIARMMGFKDLAGFSEALRERLEIVERHYARLFESAPELSSGAGNLVFTGDDDDPGTIETLRGLGFANPSDVTAAIRAWHFGRYAATRSTVARERLTELTPALLKALAATDNADAAFLAFDRFVARLPAGIQIFSILVSNPRLLDLLASIMGAAPKLAETLSRRPRVIDALLEPAFFNTLPTEVELQARLDITFGEASSYEDLLDRARIVAQEQIFLIGVRILTHRHSVAGAGAAYATLAGVLVSTVLQAVEAEMARVHGRVPGGAAAVVALGKLGGREMTAASDLDLMLLYDFDPDAEMSDGPKPLMASQYYARLAQRLIAAISAPTAHGTIYAVDFRLRPSGSKGPVATRLSSFRDYHAKEAWTWEHMALTRARVVAGPPAFRAAVEGAIRDVLVAPRDAEKLRADVAEMRRMIEAEKGTTDPWDIKQHAGGMVDVEFIAQYLMLSHAARHPDILSTTTAIALNRAAAGGLLPQAEADILVPAIRLYHGLTQTLRLAFDGPFEPRKAPRGLLDLLARVADAPDVKALTARLKSTEAAVRGAFERIVGPPGKA